MAVLAAEPPQTVAVPSTFNDKPFDYRIEFREEKAGYRLYRLTYPSPVVTPFEPNNTVPADYYLPKNLDAAAGKRPAAICLHILNGNFELEQMTCAMLASRGIPAVMIKLPYYGERSLPGGRKALAGDPKLFAAALNQAVEDVRRTIDVLASRPEIDPQKIGVVGISMGGILAGTVAGSDERVARTAMILAGGDLPGIIAQARETRQLSDTLQKLPAAERAEVERAIAAVDPLAHAAKLRAGQGRPGVDDQRRRRRSHSQGVYREAGRRAGDQGQGRLARRAGPLHGHRRAAAGAADARPTSSPWTCRRASSRRPPCATGAHSRARPCSRCCNRPSSSLPSNRPPDAAT